MHTIGDGANVVNVRSSTHDFWIVPWEFTRNVGLRKLVQGGFFPGLTTKESTLQVDCIRQHTQEQGHWYYQTNGLTHRHNLAILMVVCPFWFVEVLLSQVYFSIFVEIADDQAPNETANRVFVLGLVCRLWQERELLVRIPSLSCGFQSNYSTAYLITAIRS